MGKRKIIGGLLAALTSLSFSGGNFSSALKDEVRGTSKTKVMKNGKNLGKNKGGRKLGAIEGMSRKYARKIEDNLNKNSGGDYYKVIGYGAGGLVVAVVLVGGVYKTIKYFKNRGTEVDPELIPINKVDDKDKSKGSKGDVELNEKSDSEHGKKKEHVEIKNIKKIKIENGDGWIKELVENGKVNLDKTKGYIAGNIKIDGYTGKNVDAYVSENLSDEVAWFAASILSGGRVHVSFENRARKDGTKGTCPACNLYLKLGVDVSDEMLNKILVKAGRDEADKEDKGDKYVKDGWMKFRLVNALEKVDKLGSAISLVEGGVECLLGLSRCIVGENKFSFSLSDDNVKLDLKDLKLDLKDLKSGLMSKDEQERHGRSVESKLWRDGWHGVETYEIGNKRDMLRLVLRRVFYNIAGLKNIATPLAEFVAEKFVDS